MPQFDHGSFSHQVFFFFVFFILCYFLTTYFFLPVICKNIKFRQKKMKEMQNYLIGTQLENTKQQYFLNHKIYHVVTNFQTTFQKTNNQALIQVQPIQQHIFNLVSFKSPYLIFNTQHYMYPKYFQ